MYTHTMRTLPVRRLGLLPPLLYMLLFGASSPHCVSAMTATAVRPASETSPSWPYYITSTVSLLL